MAKIAVKDQRLKVICDEAKESFGKTITTAEIGLRGIRTSRADPTFLSSIEVDLGDRGHVRLSKIANVSVTDAGQGYSVSVYNGADVSFVEKAIRKADAGLNPSSAASTIHVRIPPMTTQRRDDFIKMAREVVQRCKLGVRDARADANKTVENLSRQKTDKVSEDETKICKTLLTNMHDETIKTLTNLLDKKETEITA